MRKEDCLLGRRGVYSSHDKNAHSKAVKAIEKRFLKMQETIKILDEYCLTPQVNAEARRKLSEIGWNLIPP